MSGLIPGKGEFITLGFDPDSVGHEQHGRRPALVISRDAFNRETGMCVICPVTNARRDYPFHVPIPDGEPVAGVVMVDQVKSVDFRSRGVRRMGVASAALLGETLAKLDACLYEPR
ncbi:MAG: mRNA-degrading endonuclease [Actinobacteria bacterium]|nr:MAG: mRNA-degrading endonuclease [Actinomycetota bacterium]